MEVEQERPERSHIAGAPQLGRKSVNWARKREVLEDENLTVFAMGSIESSSSNLTAAPAPAGREGAISPLDFAASTAVATGYHRPQSGGGGGGAWGADGGRMYGKSASRAASRGVSRTNSAVSGLRQGGLPAAGGGAAGGGGGGISAVPSSAWGGGTEGGESGYSTVFERPPAIPRRPSARSLAAAAHLNVNVGPFPAGAAAAPASGSPARPGTSAGHDLAPGSPARPITPASPSKVGLSARQRAMLDAAAVGQFRFARIPRPSGAAGGGGGGAALPSVYSSVPGGGVNVLNLEGGGGEAGRLGSPQLPGLAAREGQQGGGGGGAGLNAFRVGAAAVMAAAAFSSSPIAPYRRAAPPQPAANFGPSGAGGGGGGAGGANRHSDANHSRQQQQQLMAARPSTMAMATSVMAELNAAHAAAHDGGPLGGGLGGSEGGGAGASSLSAGLPPPPSSGATAAAIAAAATPAWAHPSAAASRGDMTSRSVASVGERKAAAAAAASPAAANASAVSLPAGGSSDMLHHAASIYQSHSNAHGHGHGHGPYEGGGGGPAVRTEVLASFVRPGRGAILQPGLVQPPPPAPDISDAEALLLGAGAGGLGPGGEAFDPAAASSAMLDAELAPLLKEVAEINVRPAVRAALGKLDDRAIKQLFIATSRRVEHLPCTPVALSSGSGLLLPLPGPKGVAGYKVNAKGQIHATTKLGHYLRVEGPGGGGGGGGHHTHHSVTRNTATGAEGGGGGGGEAPASPLAGGPSSEFSFLQQLLDQDPESLTPKTRGLLQRHGPVATLALVEAIEAEVAAAAAAAAGVGRSGPSGVSASTGSTLRRTAGGGGSVSAALAAAAAAGGGAGGANGAATPRSGSSPRRRSSASGGHRHIPAPTAAYDSGDEEEAAVAAAGALDADDDEAFGGGSAGSRGHLSPGQLGAFRAGVSRLADGATSASGAAAVGSGGSGGVGGADLSASRSGNDRGGAGGETGRSGGSFASQEVEDPLQARRRRLGQLMAELEEEEIDDAELRHYRPFVGIDGDDDTAAAVAAATVAALTRSAAAVGAVGAGAATLARAAAAAAGSDAAATRYYAGGAGGAYVTPAVTAAPSTRTSEDSGSGEDSGAGGSGARPRGSGAAAGGAAGFAQQQSLDGNGAEEDEEERGVTDEELGLLSPEQVLAALEAAAGGHPATASDELFARLEHAMKRREALAARKARLAAEAARQEAEEAARYVEVPLGEQDERDELAGPLAAGARGAVWRLRRHGGDSVARGDLTAAGGLESWPSGRMQPPAGAAAAGNSSAQLLAANASLLVRVPEAGALPASALPTPAGGADGYSHSRAASPGPGGELPQPFSAFGARSMSPGATMLLQHQSTTLLRRHAAAAAGPPPDPPFAFSSDRQRAKLEPVLGAWGVAQAADPQMAALGAFKEALLPAGHRPPPADMKPFAPAPGEAARVARRLAQMGETGSSTLDIDFGPRLSRPDFGVIYGCLRDLPPPAVLGLRAVAGALGGAGAADGLTALVKACPGIEELDLRGNPGLDGAAAGRLAPLLHPHYRCGLRVLDLGGCGALGDGGFAALAMNLAQNKMLQTLNLSGCGLGDAALSGLDRCLALNGCLRDLDLGGNNFSAAGVAALCRDLEDNRSLRRLSLAHCSLGDAAAAHLGRTLLPAHPTLTHLDLSHNALGWRGARALAEGLRPRPEQYDPGLGLPVLRELGLGGNPLGQAGVLSILKLLLVNPSLSWVCLDHVSITPVPGEPLDLDPQHPNGHYSLNLAEPEHRKAAVTLFTIWQASGGSSWLSASLDGAPLHLPRHQDALPARLRWPDAMPAAGTLMLTVRNNASLDPALAPSPAAVMPSGGGDTHRSGAADSAAMAATASGATASSGAGGGATARSRVTSAWGGDTARSAFSDLSAAGGGGGGDTARSALTAGGGVGAGGGAGAGSGAGGGPAAAPDRHVLSGPLFGCLMKAMESSAGSEVWKTQLLALATKVAYVSAEQAGRLLGRLRYRSERADAAATLLSACPDLHRAPWALATFAGFGPDDVAELLQEFSLAPLLPQRTRVVNGWQDCCTGHMRLDLAQLVGEGVRSHRLLAILLVQLATRGSGSSGWAVPQAAAPIEDLFGAATARLGDATASMRGITFGGAPLGHSVIYLSSANIPTSGLLDLHYVNVRPRPHVAYVGMGLGKQRRTAPSILSGKTPAAGTAPPGAAATTGGGTAAPTRAGSSAGGAPLQAWASTPTTAAGATAASPAGSRPYTPATATDSQSTLGPLLPEATGGVGGAGAGSVGPSRMSTAGRSSSNGGAGSGLGAPLVSAPLTASSGAPSGSASAAVSFLRRPGGGGGGGSEGRPPVAVGAGVVAVEALRMAASFLSPSLALNAQIGKKNWWQQYLIAWEGLYQEALLRLGLPHNAAGLAGWRHAGNMWKAGGYRLFSHKLHDEVRARHDSYGGGGGAGHGGRRASSTAEGADEAAAGGKKGAGKKDAKAGKKGGKGKGKGGDTDEEGGGGGKAKAKGKGGKGKGGKGAKAAPDTGGGWGPGVDAATARVLSALDQKSRQLAPLMTDLACQVSLSTYQVLHLLRLLPDFDLRLRTLVALWPAVWDRGNVVDLILDLDHPVVLPPPPKKTSDLNPLTSTTAPSSPGPGTMGAHNPATDKHHASSAAAGAATAAGHSRSGEAPLTPGAAAGGAAARSSGTRRTTGTGDGSNGGPLRSGSPGPGPAPQPEEPRLLVRPRGFTPGPHAGDELLLQAAARLGWRSLALPWATPGCLAGRTLHFHMGAIDQLQAVAALCRFNDRCFRAIGQQVVTGLACDGAAQDVDEAEALPGGLWQLILARTVLCLDRPEYGTVSMQLGNVTTEAQRAVAAVNIQAAWRGYLARRRAYEAAEARAGANRWRRLVGVMRHLRRLALMRTLGADLDISRAQAEMERGYLRMLYGPTAA
ncbi:hypothetical protein HXX76_004097 [Chlamydomonas incerta]|uniref:Uncharacterized protein n=1 Tax=Chlamydomonas incerta TaxID=51695 RepID=A0A835W7F7_CHLIN|nr:hypothetical protein HXX76_004097 [Chlamydomonas incerta]|eukprot:KAG2439979.1 hypothetical protein HXX76_004097 [Chlamydomonas incerta]